MNRRHWATRDGRSEVPEGDHAHCERLVGDGEVLLEGGGKNGVAASRSSAGAGALTRRLFQDSRGEDVGGHLVVLDPHGGGAGVDRRPLRQLPLFRADDGVEGRP